MSRRKVAQTWTIDGAEVPAVGVEELVDVQVNRLFDAMALISTVMAGLPEPDEAGVPNFHRTLRMAHELIDDIGTRLDSVYVSHALKASIEARETTS